MVKKQKKKNKRKVKRIAIAIRGLQPGQRVAYAAGYTVVYNAKRK